MRRSKHFLPRLHVRSTKIQISLCIPGLIRVFAIRLKKLRIPGCPQSGLRRLWSDWTVLQSDPSLRRVHMHSCRKCCAPAQILPPLRIFVAVIVLASATILYKDPINTEIWKHLLHTMDISEWLGIIAGANVGLKLRSDILKLLIYLFTDPDISVPYLECFLICRQLWSFNDSNTSGSFTMADSNSFLSPMGILRIAQERYLGIFKIYFPTLSRTCMLCVLIRIALLR